MILSKLIIHRSRLSTFSYASYYDSVHFRARTLLCIYDYRRRIDSLSDYSTSSKLLSDYYTIIGIRRRDICVGPLTHMVDLIDTDYYDADDYVCYENDEYEIRRLSDYGENKR